MSGSNLAGWSANHLAVVATRAQPTTPSRHKQETTNEEPSPLVNSTGAWNAHPFPPQEGQNIRARERRLGALATYAADRLYAGHHRLAKAC